MAITGLHWCDIAVWVGHDDLHVERINPEMCDDASYSSYYKPTSYTCMCLKRRDMHQYTYIYQPRYTLHYFNNTVIYRKILKNSKI